MIDRISKLLQGLDVEHGAGLEFGPLTNPILRRPNAHVLYADHVDTAGLREKYAADPNVDADAIVDIDLVWGDGALRDLVAPDHPGFDHVIASHVIEHVPDLVWWLGEIASVLAPRGALRLIVPDRRFTMDLARRESVVADAVAAHLERRRMPSPRDILDFYLNYRTVDVADTWRGIARGPDAPAMHNLAHALRLAREAQGGVYHDVHCWVFTSASFARLFGRLAEAGYCPFACEGLDPPLAGELDFFVRLRRSDDRRAIVESWDAAIP